MPKKRRKRKVPLPIQLRRLKKKADRALSLYIREIGRIAYNGLCPLCPDRIAIALLGDEPPISPKPNKIGVCFHFISRRRTILRWREDNVVGACSMCNGFERYLPDMSRAWYIKTYGHEKYLSLVTESMGRLKPTMEFLQDKINEFEGKLRALKGVVDK